MSNFPSTFNWKRGDIDSVRSLGTMSTSDSKSLDTTFTAQGPRKPVPSEISNTPCHSRTQTPDPCRQVAIEGDLRGIGHQTEPFFRTGPEVTLQSRLRHQQCSANNTTINFSTVDSVLGTPVPLDISTAERRDKHMNCQEEAQPATVPQANSITCNSTLRAVGGLFAEISSPIECVLEDGFSSSDTSGDDDLDLEAFADEALSKWFGLRLTRLERPIRVINAFEQVKEQVVAIIHDEGYFLPSEQEDQECQEDQDDQDDQNSVPRSSGIEGPNLRSTNAQPQGTSEKKRSIEDKLQLGSSPNVKTRTRNPYKKRRIVGLLSCPYRKRNPHRFNVRDYQNCATKAFDKITELKKHLCSDHYEPVQPCRVCGRCEQLFDNREQLLIHLRLCEYPPQQHTSPQQRNPEDGFNDEILERLRSRKDGLSIKHWTPLYRMLFPDDEVVPESDFEPVVEDHEVAARFQQSRARLRDAIDNHVARHTSDKVSQPCLSADILRLFENKIACLLERQGASPQNTLTPPEGPEQTKEQYSFAKSNFIEAEANRNNFKGDPGDTFEIIRSPGRITQPAQRRSDSVIMGQIRPPVDYPQLDVSSLYSSRQEQQPSVTIDPHSYQRSQARQPNEASNLHTRFEGTRAPSAAQNFETDGPHSSLYYFPMFSQDSYWQSDISKPTPSSSGPQNFEWTTRSRTPQIGNTSWTNVSPPFDNDEWVTQCMGLF